MTDVWSQTFLWILVQVWLDPVLAVNSLQEGKYYHETEQN